MSSLKEAIARDLIVPTSLIEEGIRDAHHHVKLIKIKKRSGGTRSVYQPSSKLKLIQYWLIDHCLSKIDIHESAAAFFKGASIRANAERHSKNKYFVRIDLENFFPSIRFSDLSPYLKEWHKSALPEWPLNAESRSVIATALFDKSKRLPIGFPTSPIVANIVMASVDRLIEERLAQNNDLGSITYTRYADDMVFLSATKEELHGLLVEVNHYLNENLNLGLKGNYQVFPVANRGIDFVGYRFFHTHTLMRKSIKKNFCRKADKASRFNLDEKNYKMALCPWIGWAKHCNSKNLVKTIILPQYHEAI